MTSVRLIDPPGTDEPIEEWEEFRARMVELGEGNAAAMARRVIEQMRKDPEDRVALAKASAL